MTSALDILRSGDVFEAIDRVVQQNLRMLGLTNRQQQQITEGGTLSPLADVSEDDTAYRINIELPGIDPKNVDVNVTGSTLSVRAENQQEQEQKGRNFLVIERKYGQVRRDFHIPDDVDQNRIDAQFRNGILTLNLAKSQQARDNRRRIDIKS